MPIDEDLKKAVLDHAKIEEVVSSFLPTIKKGKDYVAKCPFHDDTNPSMRISPSRHIFKCFVCGTGGDAISFVSKYLHIPYREAMIKVAEISGYDDPRLKNQTNSRPVDQRKTTLLKCLKDLSLYYSYALSTPEGKEGLDYLNNRQLDASMREKYRLGYAFNDGKATIDFLTSRGHSLKTIEDTGIAIMSNGKYRDRSEGRVIFPLFDIDGNVIGFSARRIKNNDDAKYVNSPETYLFHKSSVLYNYHIAKEKARIAGHIYVLEGFMDVFALARIGMDNAVAIMGTALTQEHIALLRQLNVEIRMCLDGDLPGQTATLKCAKMLSESGLKVSIVDNQNSSRDPDEILNQDGPDALRVYLNKLLSYEDFVLNYYKNSNPLTTNEQKKKLIAEFMPILLRLKSQLDFDNYVHKLSIITGYDYESIRDLVSRSRNKSEEETKKEVRIFHPEAKLLKRLQIAERELLYQMLHNPEAVVFYEHNVNSFYDEIYRNIANFIIDYAQNHASFNVLDIISNIEQSESENKEQLLEEITALCFENTHPKHCSVELLDNLLSSIKEEKEKIFEKDMLEQSLKDKDELERARIYSEYNRRRKIDDK
ncbi:MAG: DNA primase [Bacilli bacterium]|nr:DNA primase [Bacilli bacterium]